MGADERAEERMAKMELPVFTQWPWPKIGRDEFIPTGRDLPEILMTFMAVSLDDDYGHAQQVHDQGMMDDWLRQHGLVFSECAGLPETMAVWRGAVRAKVARRRLKLRGCRFDVKTRQMWTACESRHPFVVAERLANAIQSVLSAIKTVDDAELEAWIEMVMMTYRSELATADLPEPTDA